MRSVAREVIAVARLLIGEDEGSPGLNGMKNREARKFVNALLARHTKGFFTDDYWQPVTKTFKELGRHEIYYAITETRYFEDNNGNPSSKRWKFEIEFYNDKGRKTMLYGVIVASGAGTVKDPLSRYDLAAYVN